MSETTLLRVDGFKQLAGGRQVGGAVRLTIVGSCMDPDLESGQSVTIRTARRYWPGDALAYYCPYKHQHIVQRFLGYVRAGGT